MSGGLIYSSSSATGARCGCRAEGSWVLVIFLLLGQNLSLQTGRALRCADSQLRIEHPRSHSLPQFPHLSNGTCPPLQSGPLMEASS